MEEGGGGGGGVVLKRLLTETNTQSAIDWTQAGGSINTASSTTKEEALIFRGFSFFTIGAAPTHPHTHTALDRRQRR